MENVLITSEHQIEQIIERLLRKVVSPIVEKNSLPKEEQYKTRSQAAKQLGVTTSMIDKLARSKRLKKHKIGAKVLFKQTDLEALLAS